MFHNICYLERGLSELPGNRMLSQVNVIFGFDS